MSSRIQTMSETIGAAKVSGRTWDFSAAALDDDVPLIVALHGGTYTSAYFDLPGFSLLERAAALDMPILAIERPGYGETTPLPPGQSTIHENAAWLDGIIGALFKKYGAGRPGVVLIGHSIGGAVALSIAARRPSWPLLGVAISGVCLHTPPEDAKNWDSLPKIPKVDMPPPVKDHVMFGPAGTFGAAMPALGHQADSPIPREELLDIVTTWQDDVRGIVGKIEAPIHFRQGEYDRLWITNADEVAQFGAAFVKSPKVDAALFAGAGHCIDFHRLGASFQLEQLAFAARCGVEARMKV